MSGTKRTLPNESDREPVWVKCFSKTYNRDYWFDSTTGEKSWTEPVISKKQKVDEQDNDNKKLSDDPLGSPTQAKVAIIVPFRDNTQEKTRTKQLNRFVPEMVSFLKSCNVSFHVYIIEQSDDGRKFNRGKLLNIGFRVAAREDCNVFIFHDVDLLPSEELKPSYTEIPTVHPIHIARVWDRYNSNPNYFGGVVSFSKDMFERINGFPNNFWGWGGEDDEMYKRVVKVGLTAIAPTSGSLTDMENMDLNKKLAFLRTNKVLKCMNKIEVLKEHDKTWQQNGLSDLEFLEISRVTVDAESKYASKLTVDVQLNKHWTDERCGIQDSQM